MMSLGAAAANSAAARFESTEVLIHTQNRMMSFGAAAANSAAACLKYLHFS